VSWLGYTLYGTTLSAQSQLFARFAGLVEPTVVKRGKARGDLAGVAVRPLHGA
jgi:hypothetical protein